MQTYPTMSNSVQLCPTVSNCDGCDEWDELCQPIQLGTKSALESGRRVRGDFGDVTGAVCGGKAWGVTRRSRRRNGRAGGRAGRRRSSWATTLARSRWPKGPGVAGWPRWQRRVDGQQLGSGLRLRHGGTPRAPDPTLGSASLQALGPRQQGGLRCSVLSLYGLSKSLAGSSRCH